MNAGIQWLRYSDLPTDSASAVVAAAPVMFVMPWRERERARHTAQILLGRAGVPFVLLAIEDDQSVGPCAIWNAAFACTRGELFGYLADDAFPGRDWLRLACAALQGRSGSQLLAFNDGKWFGQLAGFGLARRAWVQTLYGTNLFHRGYHQHYGDAELSLVAHQQGALAYEPHAMLVEVDAGKDTRAVHAADRELFMRRRDSGFDGLVRDPAILQRFEPTRLSGKRRI